MRKLLGSSYETDSDSEQLDSKGSKNLSERVPSSMKSNPNGEDRTATTQQKGRRRAFI